jgi:hypothetical protein
MLDGQKWPGIVLKSGGSMMIEIKNKERNEKYMVTILRKSV